jgi:hypothetical protein
LNNKWANSMRVISLIKAIRRIRDERNLIVIQAFVHVRSNRKMVKGMMKGFRLEIESEMSKNEVDIEDRTRYQTKE